MNLSTLQNERLRTGRGIAAGDRPGYDDVLDKLWEKRFAINMMATHYIPESKEQLRFLLDVLDERLQFIEDEPVSEAEREEAFEAIRRITANVREYLL